MKKKKMSGKNSGQNTQLKLQYIHIYYSNKVYTKQPKYIWRVVKRYHLNGERIEEKSLKLWICENR